MNRKVFTLCFPTDGDRVLLGMKKKGFGAGRWNGFGGKVEEGEELLNAVCRELFEECGLSASRDSLREVGVVDFEFEKDPGNILEVHIFATDTFTGEPKESDEMRPEWHEFDEVPFSQMWPDDIYWFPLMREGKKFKGYFLFGENDTVLKQELSEIA